LDSATVNDAALHHEGHAFEHADVVDWIARYGDDVGMVAGLEGAEFVFPIKQPRAVEQIGLQHVERLHSVLHHKLELARLGAVGKGPNIRAHRHGYAVLQLAVKFLDMIVEELVLSRRPLRRAGMGGEIFLNGKGWNGVYLPFTHQAHRLVA
jgi:hypothetical protein